LAEVNKLLADVENHCNTLTLGFSLEKLARIKEFIRSKSGTHDFIQQIPGQLRELAERLYDELGKAAVYYVPYPKCFYCEPSQSAFGMGVIERFPEVAQDIAEASRCFAFGRNTASVFHLIRVLEAGVRWLGKHFKVKTTGKTWGQILSEINDKIKTIKTSKSSAGKKKVETYRDMLPQLFALKNAIRDTTIHEMKVFSEPDAEFVFNSVKHFMKALTETTRPQPPTNLKIKFTPV
jgi:hypothetical protein